MIKVEDMSDATQIIIVRNKGNNKFGVSICNTERFALMGEYHSEETVCLIVKELLVALI